MKVILKIDEPLNCTLCPCCEITDTYWGDIRNAYCKVLDEDMIAYTDDGRPDKCPLEEEG